MPSSAPPPLPVLDLGPLRAGGDAGLRDLAAEIRRAAEEVGFFYVVNHGIDPALQTAAQTAALAFFARPEAEKRGSRSTGATGASWPWATAACRARRRRT